MLVGLIEKRSSAFQKMGFDNNVELYLAISYDLWNSCITPVSWKSAAVWGSILVPQKQNEESRHPSPSLNLIAGGSEMEVQCYYCQK